jgi:hypothetical protein
VNLSLLKKLFFQKPTVEFVSSIPNLLDAEIIVPMHQYRPNWMKQEIEEYKANRAEFSHVRHNSTIAKCAGLRALFQTGWIVKTWQDIFLDVHGDGTFSWNTPIDQKAANFYPIESGLDFVGYHDQTLFKHSKFYAQTPAILKIQMPVFVKIPKGYNILQSPVPYQEHDDFVTAQGIYERGFGFFELNIQLMYNKTGQSVIKAGTPIAHLCLIKDEKVSTNYCNASLEDIQQLKSQSLLKVALTNLGHKTLKNVITKRI